MTTQTTKFWPDAEGKEYLGSYRPYPLSRSLYDLYLSNGEYHVQFGACPSHYNNHKNGSDLLTEGDAYSKCAAALIRAHQAKQQPQPPATTPAMSRETVADAVERALAFRANPSALWPGDFDLEFAKDIRKFAADLIDFLRPDLKPAPPKVEKTTGQLMVECWRRDGFPMKAMATHIDDTLQEQDAQHKLALESMREQMIGCARLWLQTIGHGGSKISDYDYSRLTDMLNRVPLTPEAKP